MPRFEGSLARTLDFGDTAAPLRGGRGEAPVRRRLGLLPGPDKYKVLDLRRRTAQIQARHALDLIDVMERTGEGR